MGTLTVPGTEQDNKLLAIPQKLEDVEYEGEAALVAALVPLALVAVAMAAKVIRHFAALVVAGCTAEVVPTIASVVAMLYLSMK